jgi:hypothetical protein
MGLIFPGFIPDPLGEIVEYAPNAGEIIVSLASLRSARSLFTLMAKITIAIQTGDLRLERLRRLRLPAGSSRNPRSPSPKTHRSDAPRECNSHRARRSHNLRESMKYDPEKVTLEFASREEAEEFHLQVSALVRVAMVQATRTVEDPEQALNLSRDVMTEFRAVSARSTRSGGLPRKRLRG